MREIGWDRLAGRYDLQLALERPALRTAVELLGAGPDERLIDVGTGTAGFLRVLSDSEHRPRQAVGIDASQRMLAQAPPLPPGWRLVRADARRLPFGDSSFDAAACTYVLHVLDASACQGTIHELARILRPGGRLVTVTPAAPHPSVAGPYGRAVTALGRRVPTLFGGLRPLDPGGALEEAGFRVDRSRAVGKGYPSLCLLAHVP